MDFENVLPTACRIRGLRLIALAGLLSASIGQAWAASKVVVISLDGCKPAIVQQLLASGDLNSNKGLGLLLSRGAFASGSMTVSPSLTAPNHIALATGSTGAHNDVAANTFRLTASPFSTFAFTISGFGAPIGGYQFSPLAPSLRPTAEPMWVALRNAGKTVVAATWAGADGVDVFVPGVSGALVQPNSVRTVDYTVPFGAFAGLGGKGFVLTSGSFLPAPTSTTDGLTAAGKVWFSPVLQASLESFTLSNVAYNIQVAALDTTDDNLTNYDTLVFFDTNHGGITAGPFTLPSTGPAYVKFSEGGSQPFYLEGSPSKAGAAFFVSQLEPNLSTVHIARYSADAIPRNVQPGVLANVDDINNNVGFWADQADFRFPERINSGLANFTDLELENIYEDQVKSFVDYQTRVALHAMSQNPNADLTMVYIEQPDGSEHQFLLTDPRQATSPTDPNSIGAGQDPAKIARYQNYIKVAYQAADQAVQRIIDAVGVDGNGLPLTNVIVVSDHGFAPFHTSVNMNNLLVANGIDTTKVRAITSGPAANIYISLQGREPNGSVSRQEYLQLRSKIQQILTNFNDTNPNYVPGGRVPVFEQVFVRPTPGGVHDPNFGLDTDKTVGQDFGDVYALMRIGYNFDGVQSPVIVRKGDTSLPPPVLSVPNFYGAHGHNPAQPDMFGFFAAAGPDIKPGPIQTPVRTIDLAPTVEELFGIEPAETVDGHPLPIFKQ
ncbi:MAG TPA: alkaline phosphatase family protein [Pyrinomonadaceae bacterium]|nr:alkaline phosphatase family protein [Pyrinomonadaceae bacterium]